ncbi:MAG: DUF2344 domain-containing protein [Planctomycetes bacterium]|nr:DUF2344 domain-containing protein [Planctomycetota bacterium]
MFRQRMRIFFTKEGLSKFLGHHDLMRLFERALRRVGLPLVFSAGFNPRPQISFPVALALGVESKAEILEVELDRWVSPRRVKESLERELPEGIGIASVQSVNFREKAKVIGTQFCVEIDAVPEDFEARLDAFLAKDEAYVERVSKSGKKRINVREYVAYARLVGGSLHLGLRTSPTGSVRPQEVLSALLECPAEKLPALRLTRTSLQLAASPHQ